MNSSPIQNNLQRLAERTNSSCALLLEKPQVVLRRIAECTNSHCAFYLEMTEVGVIAGATMWPRSFRQEFPFRLARALSAVAPCDSVWRNVATEQPYAVCTRLMDCWAKSLSYQMVFRRLGLDFLQAYCLEDGPTGNRRFIVVARKARFQKAKMGDEWKGHATAAVKELVKDYSEREKTAFQKACETVADEFDGVDADHSNAPAEFAAIHVMSLDAALTAKWPDFELEALITHFYDSLVPLKNGRVRLPDILHQYIAPKQAKARCGQSKRPVPVKLCIRSMGRTLSITGGCYRTGLVILNFVETTDFDELARFVREVRNGDWGNLARPLLSAVLFIADRVRKEADLAKKLGFTKKPNETTECATFVKICPIAFKIYSGQGVARRKRN